MNNSPLVLIGHPVTSVGTGKGWIAMQMKDGNFLTHQGFVATGIDAAFSFPSEPSCRAAVNANGIDFADIQTVVTIGESAKKES